MRDQNDGSGGDGRLLQPRADPRVEGFGQQHHAHAEGFVQHRVDGVHKGWLLKVKGEGAKARWWSVADWRYYMLDFDSQTLAYSRSEDQRPKARPIPFRDIIDAQLLPETASAGAVGSPSSGSQASQSSQGFLLRTRDRTFELHATPARRAQAWVHALLAARDLVQPRGGRAGSSGAPAGSSLPSPAGHHHHANGAANGAANGTANGTANARWGRSLMDAGMDDARQQQTQQRDQQPPHVQQQQHQRLPQQQQQQAWRGSPHGTRPGSADPRLSRSRSWGDSPLPRARTRSDESLFEAASPAPLRRQAPIPNLAHAASHAVSSPYTAAGSTTHAAASSTMHAAASSSSSPWEPRPNAAHTGAGGADSEESCQATLRQMPCDLRRAVAATCPLWSSMSWYERLRVAQRFAGAGVGTRSPSPPLRIGAVHRPVALDQQAPAAAAMRRRPSPLGGHLGLRPAPGGGGGVGGAGQAHALGAAVVSEFQRLRTIFDTHDGLQMLVGHHIEPLVFDVMRAMRPHQVAPGEVLTRQGGEADSLYIVDEGHFDVTVRLGVFGPERKVCEYGPGIVFGERAMLCREARAASVVAASSGRVWVLGRERFAAILRAPEGTKTIGMVGSVALIANCIVGSPIASMPTHAQEAGWLPLLLAQGTAAAMACACGLMLLHAMQRMPGNDGFEQRIEFTNLMLFYLPREVCSIFILLYHIHAALWVAHMIIQAGHSLDFIMLNTNGCSPGLDILHGWRYVCGAHKSAVTPFGKGVFFSASVVLIAAVSAPFAIKSLDDSVPLQFLAISGLFFVALLWMGFAVNTPKFPRYLPAISGSPAFVMGTSLFNFGFSAALPSWANEKRPEVCTHIVLGAAAGSVALLYVAIGMLGGMAADPCQGFLGLLSTSDASWGRASAIAGPLMLNLTSIPVGCILIRYNLVQSGMAEAKAMAVSICGPLVLSVLLYNGFLAPSVEPLGFVASAAVNFVAPALVYSLAERNAGLCPTADARQAPTQGRF
mmetsp:Transcript_4514/g.17146  ORF Transcript_4514/g.17146 Transcript_4514/m.17146 type:complete len:1001 (+) Transcript_4514:106-3108(+)